MKLSEVTYGTNDIHNYNVFLTTPERTTSRSKSTSKNRQSYELIKQDEDEPIVFEVCFSSTVFDSIYFYGPLVLFVSLFTGTFFYYIENRWPISTCYYFAAQALLGDMYAGMYQVQLGIILYHHFVLSSHFIITSFH